MNPATQLKIPKIHAPASIATNLLSGLLRLPFPQQRKLLWLLMFRDFPFALRFQDLAPLLRVSGPQLRKKAMVLVAVEDHLAGVPSIANHAVGLLHRDDVPVGVAQEHLVALRPDLIFPGRHGLIRRFKRKRHLHPHPQSLRRCRNHSRSKAKRCCCQFPVHIFISSVSNSRFLRRSGNWLAVSASNRGSTMVALGPARGTILVSYVAENNDIDCESDLAQPAFLRLARVYSRR